VLVVVVAVSGVPAPVVHVVDVIPVWDRNVATSFAVYMVMSLMYRVARWFAFVVVIFVLSMEVTVVRVVDVIPVWDRDVTASFAVHMIVIEVLVVNCARHRFLTAVMDLICWRLVGRDYSPASLRARAPLQNSMMRARVISMLTRSNRRQRKFCEEADSCSTTAVGGVGPTPL
jgi:hypothetical protein